MNSQYKKSEYTLSKAQVQNLFASAKTMEHRCMLKCLYYAGLRVNEVANLDVRDLLFDRRHIIVRQGKGGKTAIVPFIDEVFMQDLRILIGKRTSGLVFTQKKRMLQRIVETTGRLANLQHPDPTAKHINAHLLRHSIARHLKSDGYPAEFIKNFMRHSSINTTYDQYGTMGMEEMKQVVYQKTRNRNLLPQEVVRAELVYDGMEKGG